MGRHAVLVAAVATAGLTALSALSGCGAASSSASGPASGSPSGSAAGTPGPAGSPSGPATPAVSPTSGSGSAPAGTPAEAGWLAYSRTGGFAGVDDLVVVTADGAVTASTKGRGARSFRLSADELARLRRLADSVDPAALPRAAPTRPGTADAFAVRLSIRGRTLALPDGRVPAEVAPLLAELQRLALRG